MMMMMMIIIPNPRNINVAKKNICLDVMLCTLIDDLFMKVIPWVR